jgi:hypothetical protein
MINVRIFIKIWKLRLSQFSECENLVSPKGGVSSIAHLGFDCKDMSST